MLVTLSHSVNKHFPRIKRDFLFYYKTNNNNWHLNMASTSQSQLGSSSASQFSSEQKTINLVNFLLQRSAKQTPFKMAELLPYVDGNRSDLNSRLPNIHFILKKTYGILINELSDRHSGKRYILTATTTPSSELELTLKQRKERTLLWMVLCYIFLHRSQVTESQLKTFLLLCNIDWDEDHHFFGNVKKLIEDTFVKELYLKRVKEGESGFEELQIIYSWGERADIEVNKKDLLQFAQSFMVINPLLYEAQITEGSTQVDTMEIE